MNFVSGQPTFAAAVNELLPADRTHLPYSSVALPLRRKMPTLAQHFNVGDIAKKALAAADCEIYEISSDGVYGYILVVFDSVDEPVAFFSAPNT